MGGGSGVAAAAAAAAPPASLSTAAAGLASPGPGAAQDARGDDSAAKPRKQGDQAGLVNKLGEVFDVEVVEAALLLLPLLLLLRLRSRAAAAVVVASVVPRNSAPRALRKALLTRSPILGYANGKMWPNCGLSFSGR